MPLSGTLFLPANYTGKHRLPVLLWAYPLTVSTADAAASAARGAGNQFPWDLSKPLKVATCLLAADGYAVLWYASMPIVGGVDANDLAVAQMIANAQAAVGKLVEEGIADPARVAVAGHSAGGSMAATLLAHSTLFAAGIAIDGAYNFTLYPVGFQTETRTLWEARAAYLQLSPLFNANGIQSPLLMIHGERDSAQATPVSEAQRFYAALSALGRLGRLVVLPHEDHAPVARESIGHVAWEMRSFLDRHLSRPRTTEAAQQPRSPLIPPE